MALSEKRAQLYLSREQYKKITKLAREKHMSFAQLMRQAIDEYLRRNQARWDADPISRHAGVLEGKEPDLSENHDHYIYGE